MSTVPGGAAALPADRGVFFDDFSAADLAALQRDGWIVREKRGHPGVDGAGWGPGGVALVDDAARAGNRLLRLTASTDGSASGTLQAQVCHARKYLAGTYAARVRFSDAPVQGPDGDVVVQTFYAVAPLRFDFDPDYSELDWEYLANGGWGDARTRLYGVTWQTVRIEPWSAHNQPHQEFRSMDGWHVLVMQVGDGKVRWYIDGALRAEHGGRNYPVVPMALNFSVWFAPGGLLPGVGTRRIYQEDVDWVFHARDRVLDPAQVEAAVAALRRTGTAHLDSVPAGDPPLASPCDF
ncbi:MAG TPA: glycoside hydrolase family 16 protein [Burkholderiaceae bacterium]